MKQLLRLLLVMLIGMIALPSYAVDSEMEQKTKVEKAYSNDFDQVELLADYNVSTKQKTDLIRCNEEVLISDIVVNKLCNTYLIKEKENTELNKFYMHYDPGWRFI